MKDKKIEQMKESSAMRKKRIAKNLFLAVCSMFLAGSVTGIAVACDEGTPPPVIITEGQETGVYYFADGEQEYMLTLNSGNLFTIVGGNANRSGSYTIADGALTFSFIKIGEEETIAMTGTLEGDVLTVNYGETATRFLKKVNYTVSFETNGATNTIEAVTVMNGKSIQTPADPAKVGYSFVGWYVDKALDTPFVFGVTPVTGNTTLYAKWEKDVKGQKEYTVDFNLGYEAENPVAKTTVEGKIFAVETPEREGYTFAGWWIGVGNSADKLSYEWSENVVFDANTTLHAVWTKKPEGGKLSAPIVRVSGTNVSWDGVENAQNYEMTITTANGVVIYNDLLPVTSKNFDFGSQAPGEYKITVKALASDETKNSEETVRYYANKMLARVSQFSVNEPSVLVFNPVENADSYLITVQCGTDGHTHMQLNNGTSTVFNFANCAADEDGVIAFTVTAVADGYASSVSETYVHVRNSLSEVKGLYVDEATETLIWDEVEGATNYVVEITCGNDEHVHIANNGMKTSYSLKECDAVITESGYGKIVITVRAEAKGYASAEATEFEYKKTKLTAPSNIVLNNTILSWDEVEGATEYVVKIGAQTYTATEANIDLSLTGVNWVGANLYEISVRAKSEDNESVYSDAITVSYYAISDTLVYKNGKVSWKPVVGATVYEVKVNDGASVRVVDGSSSMPVEFKQAGINTISVRYYDGEVYSAWVSVEVYAYEILFDSRAGDKVSSIYKANGDTVVLPETERDGYDFKGWYNAPGGAAGNAAKYEDGIVNVTGSVAMYAYWTPSEVKVAFNVGSNGVAMEEMETKVTYTQNFVFPVPKSTQLGDYFIGWFSDPNGLERNRLTDEYGVSVKPCNFTDGFTAYARYAKVLSFVDRTEDTVYVTKGPDISMVKEVRIPAFYNGKLVYEMDAYSFQYASKLEKIYIPDTIQHIEKNVFYSCSKLSQLEIYKPATEDLPAGYQYQVAYEAVDDLLLYNDPLTGLKTIEYIPTSKTGSVAIPEGVEVIPWRVFTGVNVTEVVIPTTVTVIRQKAFSNCASLKRITFAPSADEATTKTLTIEKDAFQNCTALTSVSLPKRLDNISIDEAAGVPDVFTGCAALAYVNIEEGSAKYASLDGMLTNTNKTKILYCPTARAGEVSIPNVIEIAPAAFKDCDRITQISIPGCVDTIGQGAFEGCDRLLTVIFEETDGAGLTKINKNAFKDCGKLQNLIFHENSEVAEIGESAFENCLSLKAVSLHKNLLKVAPRAFANCKSIKTLAFAKDGADLELGEGAFESCLSLESVTLPGNITNLAFGAFTGCYSLEKIFVDESNQKYCDVDGVVFTKDMSEILYYSIARTATTYELPAETTRIAGSVFKGNKNLKNFVIPARVTYIGPSAFEDCSNISVITIEQGDGAAALEVGANAFKGVGIASNGIDVLTEIVFPARTASIGAGALQGCEYLEDVTLPATLTEIADNTFNGCKALSTVNIPATVTRIGNGAFANCILWANGGVIVALPSGLTEIGANAFESTAIVGVTVPETVTAIGKAAFKGCASLTAATLPAALQEIPESLFESAGLTSITFPTSVTTIGANAFYKSKLTQVVIPATVTTIGDSAFQNITTFADVMNGDEVSQYAVTFENGTTITTLGFKVFSAAGSAAGNATIKIPSTVTSVGKEAFNAAAFTSVIFADGEADLTIGQNAFKANKRLQTVQFPNRLTAIGAYAFQNSTALVSATLTADSRLVTIGNYAFDGCNSLEYFYIPNTVHDTVDANGKAVFGVGNGAFQNTYAMEELVFEMDDETTKATQLTIGTYNAFGVSDVKTKSTNLGGPIKFPARLVNIDQTAFLGAKSLTAFDVQEGSNYFSVQDGMLYNAEKTTLYLCPNGKAGEITIPNTVTLVKAGAFYFCSKITKLTFTDAVEGSDAMTKGMILGDGYSASGTIFNARDTVFDGCTSLAEIILPNYLKEIGQCAFASGTATSDESKMTAPIVESLVFPANLQRIGRGAFYSNKRLKNVTFEEGSRLTEMVQYAFYSSGLVAIEIPASLQDIEPSTFYAANNFESLTFEDYTATGSKLESIGDSAFSSTKLSGEFRIPESVTSLGASILDHCTMTTIYIPKNVTSMHGSYSDFAFKGATVTAFEVDPANTTFVSVDGVLYGKNTANESGVSTLIMYPNNKTDVTAYEVLSGTTAIAPSAFAANPNLTSLSIPKTVKTIGANAFAFTSSTKSKSKLATLSFEDGGDELLIDASAFAYNPKLAALNFPMQLKMIGNKAFIGCTGLKSMTFAEDCLLETIGQEAFSGCTSLGSATGALDTIHLPKNLVSIGVKAFYGCTKFKKVTMQEGLQVIEASAFENTRLTSLILPNTVTTLGKAAFKTTSATITTLTLSNQLTEIPESAFEKQKMSSVVIPDSVQTIGISAFANCTSLKSITWSAVLKTISNKAFMNAGFTEITIPTTVETIGDSAFEGCAKVTKINLSNGILSIGSSAFAGCSLVTEIYLPASLEALGSDPFRGINFEKFEVDPANTGLIIEKGIMYDSTKETILKYLGEAETVVIPYRTINIGGGAFANNPYVKNIVLHDAIVSIGDYAFQNTAIGGDIVFGKDLNYLGAYAFEGTNITSITFVNGSPSLQRINEGTFKDCELLSSVDLPVNINTGWDTDSNWMYIPAIGCYSFYGCTSLREIDFSVIKQCYSIGEYAFAYSGLESVHITPNCTSHDQKDQSDYDIWSYAFYSCENLTSVYIEVDAQAYFGATQIGHSIFAECWNLEEVIFSDGYEDLWPWWPDGDPFADSPFEGEFRF